MTEDIVLTDWGTCGVWADATGFNHALASARTRSMANGAALLVDDANLKTLLPSGVDRRASRLSRFALAAAAPVMERLDRPSPDRMAVILSTTFGALAASESVMRSLRDESPAAASPFVFADSVANAPAAHVAMLWGLAGANLTITQGECGPLLTLQRAQAEIRAGRADRVLVGAQDELTPMLRATLASLKALSPSGLSLPFGRERDGVVGAEGATAILVETASLARSRGARVLATLVGGGSAFDASASRAGWGQGAGHLAAAIRASLARSGLTCADVGLVISGASGARAGDRLEASVIANLWPEGGRRPAIVAPKSQSGEWGGGFLAAIASLMAGSKLAPAQHEIDPQFGITLHAEPVLPAVSEASVILVTALATGGAAAWVLLRRPQAAS